MKNALLLLAAGIFLISGPTVGQVRADRGKELLSQGKVAEAIAFYHDQINNSSRDHLAWFGLAQAYFKAGRLDSAEIAARRVVAIEDELDGGHVLLTEVLVAKNDLPAAHAAARAGLKVKKQQFPPLLISLGNLLVKMDSLDAALVAFSRARELEPNNIGAYVGEAEVYAKQGVGPMAAQRYEKALEIDSTQTALLYTLANTYLKDRQYNDAARTYQRLINLEPQNDAARLELGRLYYRAKRWVLCASTLKDYFTRHASPPTEQMSMYLEALMNSRQYKEALPIAQKLAKEDPKSVLALGSLARAQFEVKNYPASIENYNALALLDTLQIDDYRRLSFAYLDGKKDSLAVITLEKAIELDSTQPNLYGDVGNLWMRLKNWSRAAYMFEKRFTLDTTAIAAYINYGACMMQKDNFEAAASAFERAIAQRPDYPPSYTNLASCYFQMKRPEQGRQICEKAIEVVDTAKTRYRLELADAYRMIGLSFLLEKKWEDGVKNLKESIKYKDDAAQTWLLLGQGLQNTGTKNKEALEAYRRVLKLDPKNEAALKGVEILKILVE